MIREDYIVPKPHEIEIPALLVFEDKLEGNIRALVKQAGGPMGSSPERLDLNFLLRLINIYQS